MESGSIGPDFLPEGVVAFRVVRTNPSAINLSTAAASEQIPKPRRCGCLDRARIRRRVCYQQSGMCGESQFFNSGPEYNSALVALFPRLTGRRLFVGSTLPGNAPKHY